MGAKPLGVGGWLSEVIFSERLNSYLPQKPSALGGGPRQLARALWGPLSPASWTSWGRSVQGPVGSHPQPTPRIHLGTAQGACPTYLCRPPNSENAVLSTQHLRRGWGQRTGSNPWSSRGQLTASGQHWWCGVSASFLIRGKEWRHHNNSDASPRPCLPLSRGGTAMGK